MNRQIPAKCPGQKYVCSTKLFETAEFTSVPKQYVLHGTKDIQSLKCDGSTYFTLYSWL